jgi:cytosine/adenosine deaminase-related metal-dependent hydrolase
MDQPMIRGGGVVFGHARIVDVGDAGELRAKFPEAHVEDAGRSVVLPGLVNAHTHLELTNVARPEVRPDSFVDWLLHVMSRLPPPVDERLPTYIDSGARAGVAQCLRFGVTTVGDVTRHPRDTRPIVASSGLRAVSFGEVVGMAARAAAMPALLDAARERSTESDRLRVGLEPHAPYSLGLSGYRRCVEVAAREGLPITTHLAETAHEAEFLSKHQGEFRRLWDVLGAWSEGVTRFDGGPVRAVQSVGLLDLPAVLAHVNYCDDGELEILARGRASAVYCPRTHAYFGHPPHRWREMLARGVNVALGTDSCASSPDLNLVDDLRLLHRLAPDVAAVDLWKMATVHGARALGQWDRVGSLSATKDADLVVLPANSSDPLAEVLERGVLPTQVWVAGERRT